MPSSASPTSYVFPLSLHDALPISTPSRCAKRGCSIFIASSTTTRSPAATFAPAATAILTIVPCIGDSNALPLLALAAARLVAVRRRSEEHTSELQSRGHLVCRLLLRRPATFSRFPYTTLFRSQHRPGALRGVVPSSLLPARQLDHRPRPLPQRRRRS